jgi:hypothetical protein
MNRIAQRVANFITDNQTSTPYPLGRGLFLRMTIRDDAPRLQMWRINHQPSPQEAITVLNATKAALAHLFPEAQYHVQRTPFETHQRGDDVLHGCAVTWELAQTNLMIHGWHALTIKQPWLDAIMNHGKNIENRYYPPPAHVVGRRIALHASKTDDPHGRVAIEHMLDCEIASDDELVRGAIVATAVVEHAERDDANPWAAEGQYHWHLTDILPLPEPIPIRGQPKIWPCPAPVADMLDRYTQLAEQQTPEATT